MIRHCHGGRAQPGDAPNLTCTEVLTRPQTARRLNMGVRTLERYAQLGIGPPMVQLGPGRVGYRAEDLATWLASRVRA
ncbi:MAG: hypothetical protein K2X11_02540 [Acetobacteraceae bacterium]|nr:hypothetical protein [Acetobacteraceae bacterium]